nr:G-box-binding factor 3-like [Arachis hypogaea]
MLKTGTPLSMETPPKSANSDRDLMKKLKGFEGLAMSIGNGHTDSIELRTENKLSQRMHEKTTNIPEIGFHSTKAHHDSSQIVPLQVFAPALETPTTSPQQTQQIVANSPREEYIKDETINVHLPAQAMNDGILMVTNAALKYDFPAPSFILGFTQSSDEATLTEEGESLAGMEKSQDNLILVEELKKLVEVMNTEVVAALNYAKEKSPPPKKVHPTLSVFVKFETPVMLKKITDNLKDFMVSKMRVFAGGEPLMDKDEGFQAPYVNIVGQRTGYDCAIYVMK